MKITVLGVVAIIAAIVVLRAIARPSASIVPGPPQSL